MVRGILIAIGFVFLGVAGLATIGLLDQKPRLPVLLDGAGGLLVAGERPGAAAGEHDLQPGDRLIEIDGRSLPDRFYLEFFLDGLRVGERVSLVVERAGRPVRAEARLVASLEADLLVVNFFVAALVWAFAMLVLFKANLVSESLVFYGMSLSLAIVMWVYWPENDLGFAGGNWISLVLNNGLYPMTVVFLLHFSLVYPDGWWRPWMRWLTPLIYLPGLGLAVALVVMLPVARESLAPGDVAVYQRLFSELLPFELAAWLLLGLVALAVGYLRTGRESSRQRLKWLFWGFAVGIAPHVLLHELPKGFGLAPFLPEQVTYLFVIFAPTAFFISVVRYRMLDINVVIRRSLAYSLLTLFVVVIYLMVVGAGDWLAMRWWGHSSTWIRILAVLVLAAAFEPARHLVQGLVDRVFYRSEYDQRLALMEYSRELAHTLDIYQLSSTLHALFDRLLPLERVMIFTVQDDQVIELGQRKRPGEEPAPVRIPISCLPGLREATGSGAFEPPSLPAELGAANLLVPLRVDERLTGLIALGAKRSGGEFKAEDHRFIRALAAQTALAFDRARAFKVIQDLNVSLEQKVFTRTQQLAGANDRLAEQYEQLQKLNEMKEALTRMVVHDLKNPVSTILLGLEFLDRSEVGELPENVSSTLNIISSTAQEIQDLIANLLDVYRMEVGELNLSRSVVPLSDLFGEATRRVAVLAKYRRVQLVTGGTDQLSLDVDHDLFIRVLVNLLTNAVKHSRRDREIELTGECQGPDGDPGGYRLVVTNSGPVIPAELHARIFEKFFQVEGKKSGVIAGTGLGLAFCKLVVEAHGGRVWVESPVPGRDDGARFVVVVPAGASDDKGPGDPAGAPDRAEPRAGG